MVRRSCLFCVFLWFLEGPDPRSARAGAVETPFFTSGLGSKTVVFFLQFYADSWYLWDRNRSKRHQKSSLKTTSWKVYVFFCSGSVFGSLLLTLWTASPCLWHLVAIKRSRFSCIRSAGLAKSGIPPCLGATGASRLSRFLASRAQGHPENDNLACLSPKAMPSKRRLFKSQCKLGSAT